MRRIEDVERDGAVLLQRLLKDQVELQSDDLRSWLSDYEEVVEYEKAVNKRLRNNSPHFGVDKRVYEEMDQREDIVNGLNMIKRSADPESINNNGWVRIDTTTPTKATHATSPTNDMEGITNVPREACTLGLVKGEWESEWSATPRKILVLDAYAQCGGTEYTRDSEVSANKETEVNEEPRGPKRRIADDSDNWGEWECSA